MSRTSKILQTPNIEYPSSQTITSNIPCQNSDTSHESGSNEKLFKLQIDDQNLQNETKATDCFKNENRSKFLETNFIELANDSGDNKNIKSPLFQHQARSTQTWDGIICEFCRKTQSVVRHENFKQFLDYQSGIYRFFKSDIFVDLDVQFIELRKKVLEFQMNSNNEMQENVLLKTECAKLKSEIRELTVNCDDLKNRNSLMETIISKLNLNG